MKNHIYCNMKSLDYDIKGGDSFVVICRQKRCCAVLDRILHSFVLSITVDKMICFLSTMFDKKGGRKIRILSLKPEAYDFGTSTHTL